MLEQSEQDKIDKKKPEKSTMQLMKDMRDKEEIVAIECQGKTVTNKDLTKDERIAFKSA